MWREVSIRLYNVWEPSWTIRYGIFINLEIWITAVQSDDVNDEYIYVCGVWRSNVFVSSGLKIILYFSTEIYSENSVNLWCWCLFLLQNEWPVLHLFLIYFFNYSNSLNVIWNTYLRELLHFAWYSVLSLGFPPTLLTTIFLLFSMDWKEFWEKRGVFCCWSKQLIPSKLVWWLI